MQLNSKVGKKILLALFVCVLPGVILSFHNVWRTYQDHLDTLNRDANFFADQLILQQTAKIKQAKYFLSELSQFSEIQNPHYSGCKTLLERQLHLVPMFSSIGIPTPDGELICSASNGEAMHLSINDSYFQNAIKYRNLAISNLSRSVHDGELHVHMAYPVEDPKTHSLLGVAVGNMPFSWWQESLIEFEGVKGTGENAEVLAFITDENNQVMASYGELAPKEGSQFTLGHYGANPAEESELNSVSLNDKHYIFAHRNLIRGNETSDLSLTFWVALPSEKGYQTALTNLRSDIVLILVALTLSIFLLWTFARFIIMNPMASLLAEFSNKNIEPGKQLSIHQLDDSIRQILNQQKNTAKHLSVTEQQLILAYQKQDLILNSASVGIIEFDQNINILSYSQRCQTFFQVPEEQIQHQHLSALAMCAGSRQCNDFQPLLDRFEANEDEDFILVTKSLRGRQQEPEELFYKWHLTRVESQASITKWVAVIEDATEQENVKRSLSERASHDWLTKLPNRYSAMESVEESIKAHHVDQFYLVLFDLNGFKLINDTFGHDVGDALLIGLSERMGSLLEPNERLARFGGDEFLLFIPGNQLLSRINFLHKEIFASIRIQNRDFHCAASAGIAVYPKDGTDTLTLIKRADLAMYEAKRKQATDCVCYRPEMENQGVERYEMESALRYAYEHNEFSLNYQPVVNPEQKRIMSVEALIRWQSASKGWVGPDKFIKVAEEMGLINQIGLWVIKQALTDLEHVKSIFGDDVCINVNLSPHQLDNSALTNELVALAQQKPSLMNNLILEVTENVLINDASVDRIYRLRKAGYRIALDDFGTGFSSLSHIARMPIDILKIDQSFIARFDDSERDRLLLKNIVAMAKDLDLHIVAEGIESEHQVNQLADMGCPNMQGYFFSKPKALSEFDTKFLLAYPLDTPCQENMALVVEEIPNQSKQLEEVID
ncbi:diguanylate cyclase/phosphodiesterase (GGDEF & EAL domains) with PAS/PAC sensor(s) [Marinomonas sp. MED121]|uniref:bifunctional diguanylate cyclase/phosphodiesterase n=1 Tax=Marinomonas sp. MED121 TaxID=314277 RepID=UPI0000690045|nr:EAL domain-containing protein [Marinomonas sp. MED121]EAQ65599.1 diguanylate cyclase/phosphodiesterase (GGDEF & EAL domains) with PAS/PAC sensor(s) [Marinomonas sp. MED121]